MAMVITAPLSVTAMVMAPAARMVIAGNPNPYIHSMSNHDAHIPMPRFEAWG